MNTSGNIRDIEKNLCFVLKLFLRPILFHGKLSFDNLNYFKIYGNLNRNTEWRLLDFMSTTSTIQLVGTTKFLTGVRKIIVVSNQLNLAAFLLLTTRIAEALVVNITSSKVKKSHSQSNSYS